MSDEPKKRRLSPSAYLRAQRPQSFSDTANRETIELDRDAFEYRLETITSRNETGAFELFCRKLSERTLCPRLRPQTGPEGGGDSKVDTETYAASEEITDRTYLGDLTNGERWAFAFSAMEDWKTKAKADIAKVAGVQRGYVRIVFITNQFARSKDRAELEDKLSAEHHIPVTIHDRNWIIERIIDEGRKDIAFNYLGAGKEVQGVRQGPNDYSRTQILEETEALIEDPGQWEGIEYQLAAEALVVAKLSRNLERPRWETSGRFQRAIRLAERHGSFRQKLEAQYEDIWTAFWWFDDFDYVLAGYEAFATRALLSTHARDIDLVANLLQLLFNLVMHNERTEDEVRLPERTAAVRARCEALANDPERPNNALEARMHLLLVELNIGMRAGNLEAVSSLWGQFGQVLDDAKPLGEFSAERLVRLIEVCGHMCGDDPAYDALLEKLADFVAERESEAKGALMLLKRARQLDLDDNLQMIRLLSRAARWLTKKEYTEQQIEALQLLSVAYRSAGLLWASRAAAFVAIASLLSESAENNQLRLDIIPTLGILACTCLDLRHLPDFVDACQILSGIHEEQPLSDEMDEDVTNKRVRLDMCLASTLLNATPEELAQLTRVPDLLYAVGLPQSRNALLYALGHEDTLRSQGFIPPEETPESVADLFDQLARQPVSANISGRLILNEPPAFRGVTKVLGVNIQVTAPATDTCIVVAEAVLGTIDAFMATTLELDIAPHTERFEIEIVESDAAAPTFEVAPLGTKGTLTWPRERSLTDLTLQSDNGRVLYEVAGATLAFCFIVADMEDTLNQLWREDAGLRERLALVFPASNSRQRGFGAKVSRLSDNPEEVLTRYDMRPDRPVVRRAPHIQVDDREDRGHRDRKVHSVIDLHTWQEAGWTGVAYPRHPSLPPAIAFMFTDEAAARAIFQGWHERFGREDIREDIYIAIVRDIDPANPTYYNVLITSRVDRTRVPDDQPLILASRTMTMTPATSENLDTFLSDLEVVEFYILLPAVFTKGTLKPLFELAIKKEALSVMPAAEAGPEHLEFMALPKHMRSNMTPPPNR